MVQIFDCMIFTNQSFSVFFQMSTKKRKRELRSDYQKVQFEIDFPQDYGHEDVLSLGQINHVLNHIVPTCKSWIRLQDSTAKENFIESCVLNGFYQPCLWKIICDYVFIPLKFTSKQLTPVTDFGREHLISCKEMDPRVVHRIVRRLNTFVFCDVLNKSYGDGGASPDYGKIGETNSSSSSDDEGNRWKKCKVLVDKDADVSWKNKRKLMIVRWSLSVK